MNTPIGTTIIVASRRLCLIVIFLFTCFGQKLFAQEGLSSITIKETKAHKFRKTVPPGNYSGLTRLGGEHYAVVDDKSKSDGFWLFTIKIDSITGEILNVKADTFISSHQPNRDGEGIAFVPSKNTLFISGEAPSEIKEYYLDGRITGQGLHLPKKMRQCRNNYSYESLTYDKLRNCLWTVSESTLKEDGTCATSTNHTINHLRLQCYDPQSGNLIAQYPYAMEAPTVEKAAYLYILGVSELLALENGHLLVLEREVFVPKKRVGAFARCKLFEVDVTQSNQINEPVSLSNDTVSFLPKKLVWEKTTHINLFRQDFANYEGMTLGARLKDGRQTILLCSDSQNGQSGILRDWFLSLIIEPQK